MSEKVYIAIDLKSFYASVECVERKFDPLTTHLVVADASRTEKTICLAVSPSLKAYGISGRARLFEVVQRVKEINAKRLQDAVRAGAVQRSAEDGRYHFTSRSFDAPALAADPSLELSYYVAPPRMRLYEEYSTKIFSIYMKYISSDDIHVYSIDEVFMNVTSYLDTYGLTPHELAMTMIREVLYTTGITATAGIGSNMYLAKVAMDIVAKHVPADKDGVRIAELDEIRYRELLWCHRPLTDFWRVGNGIAGRLMKLGLMTMGDVARASLDPFQEDLLYRTFGINAELLIDHAWGWEPTEISMIRSYRPATSSLSTGQVLSEPYPHDKGRIIVREMTELLALDLVRKGVVTRQMVLHINYDRASIEPAENGSRSKGIVYNIAGTDRVYKGKVSLDYYGRPAPVHAHGTVNLDRWTSSARRLTDAVAGLYDEITDPDLLIRRVTIAACNLIRETEIPEDQPEQLELFVDYEALEKRREAERKKDQREKRLQKATIELQQKFGKNAVLKGLNLQDGATTIARNSQIGGHRAE